MFVILVRFADEEEGEELLSSTAADAHELPLLHLILFAAIYISLPHLLRFKNSGDSEGFDKRILRSTCTRMACTKLRSPKVAVIHAVLLAVVTQATAIRERVGDGEAKWDTSLQEVDEFREKLESVKVALVSAAVGSTALLPLLFFRCAPLISISKDDDTIRCNGSLLSVCLSVCCLLGRMPSGR